MAPLGVVERGPHDAAGAVEPGAHGPDRQVEGLGDLGIRYGYQRFMPDVMLVVVIVLIVLVQAVQSTGEWIARRLDHRAATDRGL